MAFYMREGYVRPERAEGPETRSERRTEGKGERKALGPSDSLPVERNEEPAPRCWLRMRELASKRAPRGKSPNEHGLFPKKPYKFSGAPSVALLSRSGNADIPSAAESTGFLESLLVDSGNHRLAGVGPPRGWPPRTPRY